jgi:glycosyltransferase involved in cell wall biosynthesis
VNILLLGINNRHWGGVESYNDILISILLDKGHKVVVSSVTGDAFFTLRSSGYTVNMTKIRIKNSADIFAIMKIVQLAIKENVDLIVAQKGKHYLPAVIAAKISCVPVIVIRHKTARLKRSTSCLVNMGVNAVVAVSNAVKSSLVDAGVLNDKIIVIHNCVPLNRFNPLKIDADGVRKELGIKHTDIVVGALGKIHRDKGVFELLYAMGNLAERYPFLKVLFVGSGPEQQNLESEAQRLSISDRVIFAGVRTDMEHVHAAIDLCVLPSKCAEGFGMVLIEAMSMKKPVIGSTIGGIKDIINNGVNGLLVPPGDVAALSNAIATYMEDKNFSETVAVEGRNTVESRFSDKIFGESFEDLLEDLKSHSQRSLYPRHLDYPPSVYHSPLSNVVRSERKDQL